MTSDELDLSANFWDNKYKLAETGWDLGAISLPLKTYFDQLDNKTLRILIPGGGNSYEAEYLHDKGFTNIFVADIAQTPLQNISNRVPTFPHENLLLQNFFDINLTFDLIIEQTFFCALNPLLRTKYSQKASELLNSNGKLVGLLFDTDFGNNYPPFGGNLEEYQRLFAPYFYLETFENCYNSHPARQGREAFINLRKK